MRRVGTRVAVSRRDVRSARDDSSPLAALDPVSAGRAGADGAAVARARARLGRDAVRPVRHVAVRDGAAADPGRDSASRRRTSAGSARSCAWARCRRCSSRSPPIASGGGARCSARSSRTPRSPARRRSRRTRDVRGAAVPGARVRHRGDAARGGRDQRGARARGARLGHRRAVRDQVVGVGLAAMLLPLAAQTGDGWRALYLVGLAPLLLIAWLRRSLPETARFEALARRTERGAWLPVRKLARDYPGRFAATGAIAVFYVLGIAAADLMGAKYLQQAHGWSPGQVSLLFVTGGALAICGAPIAGALSDRFGRFRLTRSPRAVRVRALPRLLQRSGLWLVPLWIAAIFVLLGHETLLSTYGAELFPTSHRSTAAGARLVLATLGGVLGLALESALYGVTGSHWSAISYPALRGARRAARGRVRAARDRGPQPRRNLARARRTLARKEHRMTLRTRIDDFFWTARSLALVAVERLETGIVFNPLAPGFREDPYPFYRRLRETDPFHRSHAGRRLRAVALRRRDRGAARQRVLVGRAQHETVQAHGRAHGARRPSGPVRRRQHVDAAARSARPHPSAGARREGVHAARGRAHAPARRADPEGAARGAARARRDGAGARVRGAAARCA